jgi:hypothetical protein
MAQKHLHITPQADTATAPFDTIFGVDDLSLLEEQSLQANVRAVNERLELPVIADVSYLRLALDRALTKGVDILQAIADDAGQETPHRISAVNAITNISKHIAQREQFEAQKPNHFEVGDFSGFEQTLTDTA